VKLIELAGTAVELGTRHLPIEDGDIIVITVPYSFSEEEVAFAKTTCQQLRDELASAGKTITTVIMPDNCKIETATRATIEELFDRLGMALNSTPEPPTLEADEKQ
jgi:hypothetical protein